VAETSRTPAPPADPLDDRARRSWLLLAAAVAALGVIALGRVVLPGLPLDLPLLGAVAGVGAAAALARWTIEQRETRRRDEMDNVARILQGFSRAVSADAVVEAILGELGGGTDADHLVVVRRRPGAPILDATLVPTRAGAPQASTVLPAIDLDDAMRPGDGVRAVAVSRGSGEAAARRAPDAARGTGDPAGRAAQRIATRVRRAFGLANVLAAPLVANGELLGAIVVSRRRAGPWPEPARRLLETAAVEASAALARTLSHRAAETAASTDALTGLPNRRYFEEYVELLARGRRADDAVGILMVDVDHFKALNDRHGHAVGDAVLQTVARTIGSAVRDVDVPARFGGEEFVVLVRNPTRATVLEVGERIRGAVERMDVTEVGVERVTVSVGAAMGSAEVGRVADLVVAADRALYRAKRFGRNRVEGA